MGRPRMPPKPSRNRAVRPIASGTIKKGPTHLKTLVLLAFVPPSFRWSSASRPREYPDNASLSEQAEMWWLVRGRCNGPCAQRHRPKWWRLWELAGKATHLHCGQHGGLANTSRCPS
jgi:hypothetical protein